MKVHVHVFWTYSGSKLSRLVGTVEAGYTHCGILFVDRHGNRLAFEARSENGWTGPYDFADTQRYIQNMNGRMSITPPLPLTEDQATRCYNKANELRDTSKPYAKAQLLWIWLARRYHVTVPRSPDKMICSEGVARVLEGVGPFPKWLNVDAITPMGLYRWYCEWVAQTHRMQVGDWVGDFEMAVEL